MNAVCPFAKEVVGPPVQFVVNSLRVAGAAAFASLTAQRPGGVAIDPYLTPPCQQGQHAPQEGNLNRYYAPFVRGASGWKAQHFKVDATDVWWSGPALCEQYHRVVPEVC